MVVWLYCILKHSVMVLCQATLGEGLDKWGYGLLARSYNKMMAAQHTMMSFKYLKALPATQIRGNAKFKYGPNTGHKHEILIPDTDVQLCNCKSRRSLRTSGNLTET